MLCNLHRFQLFEACFLLYLVVSLVGIVLKMPHIGNIAHVAYLITQMLEIAEKYVERDCRARMSQMGIAVNRRTAYIHAHIRCMQRLEYLLLS